MKYPRIFPILLAAALLPAWTTATRGQGDPSSPRGGVLAVASVAGPSPDAPSVLLLGGLKGRDSTAAVVGEEVRRFASLPESRRLFTLTAIAISNPAGAPLSFPPSGTAYRENAEAHTLWRWIAAHPPDLVVIAGADEGGLEAALAREAPGSVGRIPALRVEAAAGLLDALPRSIPFSEGRLEMRRRLARTPAQTAAELEAVYGRDFDGTYIPGMALIARLRLGRTEEVRKLAEPFADGSRNALARPNSLVLAGHLVFAELAERTGDPRYLQLVRRAADLGFTETGEMKESMPYHDEMSDSVFMATSLAARAGRLTGERKYFDMAARHLRFMEDLVRRPDGLYRHSPVTNAAWGRGNAFPALGLALTLADFPKDHPEYAAVAKSYRDLMQTLAGYQTEEGMWLEVVDDKSTYPEFSATAMIGTAYLIGIRNGWLPESYRERVERAWRAVNARTGRDGRLIDVCESTPKQRTDEDYRSRAAIMDVDPRGGGMALMFATEMGR